MYALSIHPSGRVALSVGKDSTLRVWNLISGKLAVTTKLKTRALAVEWLACAQTGFECFAQLRSLFVGRRRVRATRLVSAKSCTSSMTSVVVSLATG